MPRGGFRLGSGAKKGSKYNKTIKLRKRYEAICPICGKLYFTRGHFCSKKCWSVDYYKHKKQFKKKVEPEIITKRCFLCKRIYTTLNKRQKYCSKECCLLANHEKQIAFPHICEKCGKDFKGAFDAKYCSNDCAHGKNFRTLPGGEVEKRCTLCGEWKPLTTEHYYRNAQQLNGFGIRCKLCDNKAKIERSKSNHSKELRRLSRIKNIETTKVYNKKIQPKVNEREKIRSRIDPSFALNRRMRSLLYNGLKKAKGGRSWQDLVGYTIEDLKGHLEKQFKDGMTWGHFLRGEIHIDHKKPRSAFKFSSHEDPEFKECWDINNLQPLWAVDNLKKGSKLIFSNIT